jgi:hypothetical protein
MIFSPTPVQSRTVTHIDINDRAVRIVWAERYGVTDAQLRKAVRMVGSRITTLSNHLRMASAS